MISADPELSVRDAGQPAPVRTSQPPPGSPAGLSFVVPFVNDLNDLRSCLQALDRARGATVIEVLVVERHGGDVALAVEFPWVRVLSVPPGTPIPAMRAFAVEHASAPSVAIIEDHVILPPGWVSRALEARAAGDQVAAGPIENAATDRLVDWAAFLCEYGPLTPPVPTGPVDRLPGNNTVYDRTLLARHHGLLAAGGWEDSLHTEIRAGGVDLVSRPGLLAAHRMHYSVASYTAQRYLYSRGYAGMRARGAPLARRVAMGFAAFALPPILLWRVGSTVWRKRRHRFELVRAFPLVAWFTAVWAAGEVIGYWFGPGDAPERIR